MGQNKGMGGSILTLTNFFFLLGVLTSVPILVKIDQEAAMLSFRSCIGVARGCSGCTCTPQGGEKIFFRPNLQEKCVSASPQDTKCTPQPEQESIFRSFCWVVKKCTPADEILATPMYTWGAKVGRHFK